MDNPKILHPKFRGQLMTKLLSLNFLGMHICVRQLTLDKPIGPRSPMKSLQCRQ